MDFKELGYTCWVPGPTGYHFDRQLFAEKITTEYVDRLRRLWFEANRQEHDDPRIRAYNIGVKTGINKCLLALYDGTNL